MQKDREKPGMRAVVRAARPLASPTFAAGVQDALARLPERGAIRRSRVQRVSVVAAALALLLALAGPSLVRAVAPVFQRLFSQSAEQVQREQALPEGRRVEENLAEREQYVRSHRVEATANLADIAVELVSFSLLADPNQPGSGELGVALAFPGAPEGFDPAKLDFMLEVDGRSIPMIVDGAVKDYRATGTPAVDGDGWGNVHFTEGGLMLCEVIFPYDHFETRQDVDFVVVARNERGELRLPFTYKPEQAHAEALADEQANLAAHDAMQRQQLITMQDLAAGAVPVGVSCALGKASMTLEEMAIDGKGLHFAFALRNSSQKTAKMSAMSYGIDTLLIDGLEMPYNWRINAETTDGVTSLFIDDVRLMRDPRRLPVESLFELRMTDDDRAKGSLVFRYNWQSHIVAVPADDAQRDAWLAQSAALAPQGWAKNDLVNGIFYVNKLFPQQPVTQTHDGITLTLAEIWVDPPQRLRFTTNLSEEASRALSSVPMACMLDGLPATAYFQEANAGQIDVMIEPQVHYREIDKPTLLTLMFTMPGGTEPFAFEIPYDPDKIQAIPMQASGWTDEEGNWRSR